MPAYPGAPPRPYPCSFQTLASFDDVEALAVVCRALLDAIHEFQDSLHGVIDGPAYALAAFFGSVEGTTHDR